MIQRATAILNDATFRPGDPAPITEGESRLFDAILARYGVSSSHYWVMKAICYAMNQYAGGDDGVRATVEMVRGAKDASSVSVAFPFIKGEGR
jgi:hypothetical protein